MYAGITKSYVSGIGAQRNSEKNQVECDCAESHWSKEHHITTYIGVLLHFLFIDIMLYCDYVK